MIISLILGLLLGAVAVIFALQNITTITVAFLTWHVTGSLALILILAVLAGIIISLLISIPEVIRNSYRISQLRRHNRQLHDELETVKRERDEAEARHVHPKETRVDAGTDFVPDSTQTR